MLNFWTLFVFIGLVLTSEPVWTEEYQSQTQDTPSEQKNETSSNGENGDAKEDVDKDKDKEKEKDKDSETKEPPRRALPGPFPSPPFPSSEFQGYPLIGVPPDDSVYPLMQSFYDAPGGDMIKKTRIKAYGWINGSGNLSNCKHSNMPFSYWFVPNRVELDQLVFRIERQVDSVQTDHMDIGFRSTILYGIDYRYMTAGGWTSSQLLKHNDLYGYDFTEQYIDIYTPRVAQGMILRIGRWIACPDIETQFAPDNYIGSHSILFTFDTYTQTGIMATIMLNKYWTVQACIHSGTDMAPWYKGALPTGMFGVRWVSCDNKDSVYLVLNSINAAKFRRFKMYGEHLGHDNFNYLVGTWQHKFSDDVHTKTEAYFMWQRNAVVDGTPSAGPVEPFGGGGGIGANIQAQPGIMEYLTTPCSGYRNEASSHFVTKCGEMWMANDPVFVAPM